MDRGRGNNMKEQSSFGEYFDAQYDRLRKMLDNKDAQLHKQWLEEYEKRKAKRVGISDTSRDELSEA